MPHAEMTSPGVGEWFLDLDSEEEFQIVDVEDDGSVEVQYLNGELAEFSAEEWRDHELSKIEPPEDWEPSLEPLQEGDAGYDPESYEKAPRAQPLPGFEEEDVLLHEEQKARDNPTGEEEE